MQDFAEKLREYFDYEFEEYCSEDDYYQPGDYIGKLGIEKYYEKQLRGEKGIQILLRDAHGRIQGHYQHGKFDTKPVPGKDLTLSIDVQLQALGERLLEGSGLGGRREVHVKNHKIVVDCAEFRERLAVRFAGCDLVCHCI